MTKWQGGGSWKTEAQRYASKWPKGYKVVTVDIEGVRYKFRVDPGDVITFIIEPKYKNWGKNGGVTDVAPQSIIGMTVTQFIEMAKTPLMITDPIIHPPTDYQLSTALGVFVPEKYRSISPAAYSYFEKLAQEIARYLSSISDDIAAMSVEQRALVKPYQEFALGLLHGGPNVNILPFTLAQQFILNAPDNATITDANVDKFFQYLTEEVYKKTPETSYEKLFEAYHDANQLRNEQLRGTLREAEILDMHSSQMRNVVTDYESVEERREKLTESLIESMTTELTQGIRQAWEDGNRTKAQRMQMTMEHIRDFLDGDSSIITLDKAIAREPEFSVEIRMEAAKLYNQTIMNRLENQEIIDQNRFTTNVKEISALDEAKRISKVAEQKYASELEVAVRSMEVHGTPMESVVSQFQPHLGRYAYEAGRSSMFGIQEAQGVIQRADEQHRNRMYGIKKPVITPHPKTLKISGNIFDSTGILVKKLRPASNKFKLKDPSRQWRRKLSQGVVDLKLKVFDFKQKGGAYNLAVLDHLFQRFGGDANAFGKLKKAIEDGVDVAFEDAVLAVLPTFSEIVHQETGHFRGMDKLRASRRGVFYEFVPPTMSDIKINKTHPYNVTVNYHWIRVNVSRSLAFYRDKEGKPAGERLRRVQQMQSTLDAAVTPKQKRRAYGIGLGLQKEQRGQDFIIQKYLDRRKRSFLEGMDKQQLVNATRNEISALFGDEAGAAVRHAFRSGQSTTLALAQHLGAHPGDRIHVYMNPSGEVGLTVSKVTDTITPGVAPRPDRFIAVPTTYRRISTVVVPTYTESAPQEPVSDSFRGAMRAIASGGYSGNIFQKLANILWNVDIPTPDWEMEQLTLSTSQVAQATTWLRDRSREIDTKLSQGVAEARSMNTIEDRVIAPAVKQIVEKTARLSSTSQMLLNQFNRKYHGAIDSAYVVGWTSF